MVKGRNQHFLAIVLHECSPHILDVVLAFLACEFNGVFFPFFRQVIGILHCVFAFHAPQHPQQWQQ